MRYGGSLDWLNFLLADVRGGLGPYVSVFLLTEAHWDQATIGAVLTVSGIIGITLHTPVGALIDTTHRKRALLIAGVVALSICALSIPWQRRLKLRVGWPAVASNPFIAFFRHGLAELGHLRAGTS
jgi:predicted MFS family arabinose efflux permease